jgi:Chaperone of endosialidase
MNRPTCLPRAIASTRSPINRSPLRHGFLLIALVCFALLPLAVAVSPAPDGDYPGENTAEGHEALNSLTSGTNNTATGFQALFSNTTGGANTATGWEALSSNNADNNTATGFEALGSNKTGIQNTATGAFALSGNDGNNNTATGFEALSSNLADNNTATGAFALNSNITGTENTANGAGALQRNTTGGFNTANGVDALNSNTTGSENTANGAAALSGNTTGNNNTATGEGALLANKTGSNNTATGLSALESNTAGSKNTADGVEALVINTGNSNTASGYFALINNTTGSNNIAFGANAGFNLTTGSNNIDIGNIGVAGESAKVRIGTVGTQKAVFIAGIHGVTVASGLDVVVGTNGQLGTITSSARFKEAIKPMDKASEAILALKPVTFHYKKELDPDGVPQFGLVAEQVEKVSPDLVARDADGKVYTVRYEAVNAMLLNEFLKEHRKVEEQGATIAEMKKQIEALTATVQKVSDQVAPSKPALQLVANH